MDKGALGVATFDLVLVCEVLEHVSDPMQVLRDVLQHVRLGGLLYITVPNGELFIPRHSRRSTLFGISETDSRRADGRRC